MLLRLVLYSAVGSAAAFAVAPTRALASLSSRPASLATSLRPSSSPLLGLSCQIIDFDSYDADGPEGGWAPPAHKRDVTNPLSGLVQGQKLTGKVRNMEEFGAFVDVGAERDGFLHVSDIGTDFVHSPADLLRSGKTVDVWVKYVNAEKGNMKLGVTMVKDRAEMVGLPLEKFKEIEGEVVEGRTLRVTNFGVYLDVGAEVDAFMHNTDLPIRKTHQTRMALDEVTLGRMIKVLILEVNEDMRRIKVTGRTRGEKLPEERERFAPPSSLKDVFQRGPKE